MEEVKSKSLRKIEEKMAGVGQDSFRYHVLLTAKNFKTSWIELGRSLYTVWKDKKFKEWGYSTFDIYIASEVGIRKQTGMKLLKSYSFLEKEEPQYLKEDYADNSEVKSIPAYEAVDLLRQAKNKKSLDSRDYERIKNDIFMKGRDAQEVKKDLTSLIRQREEVEPEEAWERKKQSTLKRYIGTLKALRSEMEEQKLIPASLLKEVASLIDKLEIEIS
ncbi:MAG: hypothetical protein WCY12_04470 [Candidatus Omnitrophota bacterium]|jgi:hypothetical protein